MSLSRNAENVMLAEQGAAFVAGGLEHMDALTALAVVGPAGSALCCAGVAAPVLIGILYDFPQADEGGGGIAARVEPVFPLCERLGFRVGCLFRQGAEGSNRCW